MVLYAVSGLGADERVYGKLHLNSKIIPIKWIDPEKNESLEEYAHRLQSQINPNEKFGIIGVSFGGMIAVELSKKMNPQLTILISSADTRSKLRVVYRIIGKIGLLKILPKFLFRLPSNIIRLVFGAQNSRLLYKILNDTDPAFVKWALCSMVEWENKVELSNCYKIHGEKDILIPPYQGANTFIVKNGQHFMIVDKSVEISAEINRILDIHQKIS